MVDCTDCRTLLIDYERGELDAGRDAAMYEHLLSCADCHAEWQADLAMVDALRTALVEREMPTSILAGVRQVMHADAPPSLAARLRLWFRPVVAAPIAAALIIGGFFIQRHYAPGPQPAMTGMDFVREHVAATADLPSSDRTWTAYILTSANSNSSEPSGDNATPSD